MIVLCFFDIFYLQQLPLAKNCLLRRSKSHNKSMKAKSKSYLLQIVLDIDYFYDEAFTKPIDTRNCSLQKGESIYVSKIDVKNTKSNLYSFSEFRFVEYDSEGKRGESTTSNAKSGAIYTLPNDFDGQGISVLPVGSYKDREIKLESYFFDEKGEPVELTDKMWRINEGGDLFANGTQTVSPVESYILSFDYSPYKDSYYFVKSSPECFYPQRNRQ